MYIALRSVTSSYYPPSCTLLWGVLHHSTILHHVHCSEECYIILYPPQDLAARNVLVTDNETCKVADFGLLRELPKDESFYHMQTNVPCPVRWMPPESITERNFSTASDVWSFGILIWEMFNPTKNPYTSFSNIEVATKVMHEANIIVVTSQFVSPYY